MCVALAGPFHNSTCVCMIASRPVHTVLSEQWGSTFPSWLSRFHMAPPPRFVLYLIFVRFSRKHSLARVTEASGRKTNQLLVSLTMPSHLPFRRRERAMLRFRQMKSLQKFASIHANFHNHFNQERHLVSRQEYKSRRSAALAEWQILNRDDDRYIRPIEQHRCVS